MKVYDDLDLNKDGKVDREEMKAAAMKQGRNVTQEDIDKMFEQYDTN